MNAFRQFSVGTLFFLVITAGSTFARADQQQKCPQVRQYPQFDSGKDADLEDARIYMNAVGVALLEQLPETAVPFFEKLVSSTGCDPLLKTLSKLSMNYRGELAKDLVKNAPEILQRSSHPDIMRCYLRTFGSWLHRLPYENFLLKCLVEAETQEVTLNQ